jgi:SAM-dependent methyltransferase
VAATYDAARPGYPAAGFDRLVEITGLGRGSVVLEVGAGTGQATVGLLARELTVVCLEPSAELAGILRRNVGDRARVVVSDLQGYDAEPDSLDLLFGATALHWIPADCLQRHADTGLRARGWVASLTNRHTSGATDAFFTEVQQVYRQHAPELARGFRLLSPEEAAHAEPVVAELRGYGPAQVESFPWRETYSASDYVRVLSTYSTHITLPDDARRALLDGIEDLADRRYGGSVVKDYVAVLTLRPRSAAA